MFRLLSLRIQIFIVLSTIVCTTHNITISKAQNKKTIIKQKTQIKKKPTPDMNQISKTQQLQVIYRVAKIRTRQWANSTYRENPKLVQFCIGVVTGYVLFWAAVYIYRVHYEPHVYTKDMKKIQNEMKSVLKKY